MSDIARLRKRIEDECVALQRALNAPAIVASHQAIKRRYNRLGNYRKALEQFVGESEAIKIMCEAHNRILG